MGRLARPYRPGVHPPPRTAQNSIANLTQPILWGQTGLIIWSSSRRLQQSSQVLSESEIKIALKCLFAYYHLFNWGISLAKLSALCFYTRVFSVDLVLSRCIKFAGVLVVVWPLAFTLSAFGECRPLSKAWDPLTPGTCFDIKAWWLSNAISDVAIDLLILVMPMPLVWNMKTKTGHKILTTLIFLAGYGYVIKLHSSRTYSSVTNLI